MKLQRLLVYSALNLLMAVMVGKGMLHLSNGASAGYRFRHFPAAYIPHHSV